MRQADLPGHRDPTASHQSDVTDAVMRSTKRSLGDRRLALSQLAHRAVNPGRFK